jgi:hypothetical protein
VMVNGPYRLHALAATNIRLHARNGTRVDVRSIWDEIEDASMSMRSVAFVVKSHSSLEALGSSICGRCLHGGGWPHQPQA